MKSFSFLLTVAVVFFGSACGDRNVEAEPQSGVCARDVKTQTKEALEATKELTVQRKEDFKKKMRAELDRIQKQIDHFTAKATQAKKEAQTDLNKAIAEMQKQKDAAGKKLHELESTSEKAWGDLKSGLNTAMEDLEKSYKRTLSSFQ